jgi:clan AA aspartic protease
MISGIVNDGHPTVKVVFLTPHRNNLSIEFVIDTGFTDELCLPPEAVGLLNLPFKYAIPANLANNSQVTLPVHEAMILWNGEEREVRVLATGRRPLLGTALLEECELVVQFTDRGLVTIEQL